MASLRNLFNKLLKRSREKTFQETGSYWDLHNYRVIQMSDGSYSLQFIDGMRVAFTLDNDDWTVIGSVSDGDSRIYLFSTENETNAGGPGEIGYVDLNVQSYATGTYRAIYYHADLNFSILNPIVDIARAFVDETTNIKRIYWSDNKNVPRVLNTRSDKLDVVFSTNVNVQYQVVSGTVVYGSGSTTYGPGQAAGNVFTGATGYPNWTGSGRVIKHISVVDLAWTPDKDSGYMYFNGYASGGILPNGSYLALSTLISTDGYRAPYSYHPLPIMLGEEGIDSTDVFSYHDYQGAQETLSSGKSIKLSFENIDQSFAKIEVVLIRFTGEGTYELPRIYHSGEITGTSMEITIDGQASLGQLTVEQLKSVINVFQRVGTMAFNKNRMFVGDTELKEGTTNWNPGNVGHEYFDYETPSDHFGAKFEALGNSHSQSGHNASGTSVAASSTAIKVGQWYEVTGDSSNYATYNGNIYYPGHANGAYFQGTFGSTAPFHTIRTVAFTGSPTLYPVIRIAKFTGSYRYHRIVDDFLDMKGILVSNLLKSLKRGGEKYRWGLLPISLEGVPLPIHWLGDWSTPNISDGYPLTSVYQEDAASASAAGLSGKFITNTKHLGIKIGTPSNPLDITSIADKISAIAIVRAERIKKSVAQGLVRFCVPDADDSTRFRAEASQFLYNDRNRRSDTVDNGMINNAVMFYSPEYQFENYDMSGNFSDMQIRISDYLGDPDFPGSSYVFSADSSELFGIFSQVTYPMHKFTSSGGDNQYSSYFVKYISSNDPYNTSWPKNTVRDVNLVYEVLGAETATAITGLPRNYNAENWSMFYQRSSTSWFASRGKNEKSNILVMEDTDNFNHPGVQEGSRMLCDILDPDNLDPNYGDISNTEYILTGHLLEVNDALYTANGNSWRLHGIEVFGGDIFVNLYNTNLSVTYNGIGPQAGIGGAGGGVGLTALFPVESTINTALRRGRHGFRDGNHISGIYPEGVKNGQPENFIIDKQYLNGYANEYTFASLPTDFIEENTRQNTVFFSDVKVIGETIDAFRRFPSNNERSMEINNGGITALARQEGKLFCFQKEGVLYLPIEEASTVSNDIGESVFIGVGGVIDRYDERTEFYGLQDRHHLVKMKEGFLWVDIHKAKVCYIGSQGSTVQLSTILGMGNYFEEFIRGSDIQQNANALNPFTGVGISSVYHERFNEAYLTFLTTGTDILPFTIGFNETEKSFTGRYGWLPSRYLEHNGEVYAQPGKFNKNGSDITDYGTSIPVSTFLAKGTKFLHTYNGNTVLWRVNQDMTTVATTDPGLKAEFSRISDTNEFWQFDSPLKDQSVVGVCRILGEVQDCTAHIIVNGKNDLYKRFDFIELQGNAGSSDGTNDYRQEAFKPDFVSYITEEHEHLLHSTRKWKFRRGRWFGNLPRDNRGEGRRRFRGSYVEVILYHDHNAGKSSTLTSGEGRYQDDSDNKKIKIVSLFTGYEKSKDDE